MFQRNWQVQGTVNGNENFIHTAKNLLDIQSAHCFLSDLDHTRVICKLLPCQFQSCKESYAGIIIIIMNSYYSNCNHTAEGSVVLSCTQAPHQLTTKNKWSPVQASHGRAHILEYLINISSETQCFADTSLVQLQVRNCWEIWLLLVDGSKWKLLPIPFVF